MGGAGQHGAAGGPVGQACAISQRLRPARLAAYNAVSARLMTSETVSPVLNWAMPKPAHNAIARLSTCSPWSATAGRQPVDDLSGGVGVRLRHDDEELFAAPAAAQIVLPNAPHTLWLTQLVAEFGVELGRLGAPFVLLLVVPAYSHLPALALLRDRAVAGKLDIP